MREVASNSGVRACWFVVAYPRNYTIVEYIALPTGKACPCTTIGYGRIVLYPEGRMNFMIGEKRTSRRRGISSTFRRGRTRLEHQR